MRVGVFVCGPELVGSPAPNEPIITRTGGQIQFTAPCWSGGRFGIAVLHAEQTPRGPLRCGESSKRGCRAAYRKIDLES